MSARVLRQHRQQDREQAEHRQKGADLKDEGDRGVIGELAERRRAETADAECESETADR